MPTSNRHVLAALACAGAAAVAGGCWQQQQRQDIVAGAEYPAVAQSRVLDVQVIREGTNIRMQNTSAHTIPACRMWVNRWYSRTIEEMPVGASVNLHLGSFRDQYGQAFRAGGFFATERSERLVQAQLEVNGQIIGLIVVIVSE